MHPNLVAGGARSRRRALVTRALPLLLVLLASLAHARPAAAQERGTVTIFVRGPEGPLAGAAIVSGATTLHADHRGIARLALTAGSHAFRVERPGYVPAHVSLILLEPRDTALIVTLDEAAVLGQPIYVLSTRGDRLVEQEPLRVEVITREEIEEKLLMTPGSIAMLLDEAAGVRVQETNAAIGGASVRIHGLRGRYAQILVDGLPLHGTTAGALGPLQIPPADLRQVEVIKGAASALYGGAALGGVINLISRMPEEGREVLTNRTSRGGTDLVLWSSDIFGDRWGYTFLGGLHAQDQMDIDGDGWSELPRYRRVLARPRFFWGDGVSRAMLTAGFTAESRTGGGFVPGGILHPEARETRRMDVGATSRFLLRETLQTDVRTSATRSVQERRIGRRVEEDTRSTLFAEAALRGQAIGHIWVVGAAVQYEALDADAIDPQLSYSYITPALFAQDEIELAPWLSLSLSGRIDAHSEFGTFFSPHGAVLLGPFGAWTLRFSAGAGFLAPTPLVDEVGEVGLGQLESPLGLRPERARSSIADLGAVFGPLELNAALFSSLISDPIAFLEPEEQGRGRLINLAGRTQTLGTELMLRLRTDGAAISAYHSFIQASEPVPAGRGRAAVPLTPRHTAGVIAMIEGEEWGRVGVESYYTGRQRLADDPYAEHSEPYTVVGVLVERRIGPVRIFVNAENLTNVRQSQVAPLIRPQPTATGRWTTDVHMPLEGRVVNGGFRVFF